MRTVSALIYLYFFVFLSGAYALTEPPIIDSLPRGLVVIAGVPAAEVRAISEKLQVRDRYLIQCLACDGSESATLRSAISTHALDGKIHVKTLTGKHLPFSDNMVNGLILGETSPVFNAAEITRVLAPNGVALVQGGLALPGAQELDNGWHKFIKPWPDGMDSWTHFAYDASGSMHSRDTHVGGPRHLQWVAGPKFTRSHEHISSITAVVSDGGRLFSIIDEGPTASIYLPPQVSLVARDAFNGLLLWQKRIPQWYSHLYGLKSGPQQLARRLVAVNGKVYVTLGIDAPVSVLDGETGKVESVLKGTENTSEILWVGNKLVLLVNGTDKVQASVVVHDLNESRTLWRGAPAPWVHLTLASDGSKVFACHSGRVVALDMLTGEEAWGADAYRSERMFATNQAPGLLVHDGVLVLAMPDTITAFHADTGKQLWQQKTPTSDYRSPTRVFVVDGLVWTAAHPAWPKNGKVPPGTEQGIFKGFDYRTGELKGQIDIDPKEVGIIHHRCYIPKAVDKYILTSWPGIEFVDTVQKSIKAHNWIRGACLYGIMPANGMIYAPPNPCVCYNQGRQYGYLAVSSQESGVIPGPETRLEKGLGYGAKATVAGASPSDAGWHTYRGDNARSGYTAGTLNAKLERKWQSQFLGELTPPVVVSDKVYVADKDSHTVYALNTSTGEAAWRFVADAMVDSPPSWFGGNVYFGCRDGYVYCLNAADGQLRWRFLAAQEDRQIIAYDRIESQWPVHGSVTIEEGRLYFVAGRNAFMDNGMDLYCLDPVTGRQLAVKRIHALDQDNNQPPLPGVFVNGLNIDTTGPDILSSDGNHLFLRHKTLSLDDELKMVPDPDGEPHLYASMGFLEDHFFHRTYWVYDKGTVGFRYAWLFGGGKRVEVAAGQRFGSHLAVMDSDAVYHFGKQAFSMAHPDQTVAPPYFLARVPKGETGKTGAWTAASDVWVRAMLVTDKLLFVSGPSGNWHTDSGAFSGKKVVLRALDKATGKQVAETPLDGVPVFNGIAAAGGRMYVSLASGEVVCLE